MPTWIRNIRILCLCTTMLLGPMLQGMARLGHRQALRWEAGVVWGLDTTTADYTLRAVLEYEF